MEKKRTNYYYIPAYINKETGTGNEIPENRF